MTIKGYGVLKGVGVDGKEERDNSTPWQDGGLLVQFKDKWVAIFLAFLSQSWCTDEKGHSTESL
ncbi:MAG: DUF2278 family protein [Bacillota bacterium]